MGCEASAIPAQPHALLSHTSHTSYSSHCSVSLLLDQGPVGVEIEVGAVLAVVARHALLLLRLLFRDPAPPCRNFSCSLSIVAPSSALPVLLAGAVAILQPTFSQVRRLLPVPRIRHVGEELGRVPADHVATDALGVVVPARVEFLEASDRRAGGRSFSCRRSSSRCVGDLVEDSAHAFVPTNRRLPGQRVRHGVSAPARQTRSPSTGSW